MEPKTTIPTPSPKEIKNNFIKQFNKLIERRDRLFSLFRKKLEEEKIQELRQKISSSNENI